MRPPGTKMLPVSSARYQADVPETECRGSIAVAPDKGIFRPGLLVPRSSAEIKSSLLPGPERERTGNVEAFAFVDRKDADDVGGFGEDRASPISLLPPPQPELSRCRGGALDEAEEAVKTCF